VDRTFAIYTAEKLLKLEAAEEKRWAKKQEKICLQNIEDTKIFRTFVEENAELIAGMIEYQERDSFLRQLILDQLCERNFLTERQMEVARERIVKYREDDQIKAASDYIGKVGDRIELEIELTHRIHIDLTGYGNSTNIFICKTLDNQIVVYKGNSFAMPWGKGETAKIKATIKEHKDYKGTKQTIIERPKVK
jgi:hypothetical protein